MGASDHPKPGPGSEDRNINIGRGTVTIKTEEGHMSCHPTYGGSNNRGKVSLADSQIRHHHHHQEKKIKSTWSLQGSYYRIGSEWRPCPFSPERGQGRRRGRRR